MECARAAAISSTSQPVALHREVRPIHRIIVHVVELVLAHETRTRDILPRGWVARACVSEVLVGHAWLARDQEEQEESQHDRKTAATAAALLPLAGFGWNHIVGIRRCYGF